ncbi:metal-sensitive transcriptional regulator [Enterococcus cecorum]|uniref:metal-sensitive transcriptional regulator n=1 Tax=Enterococcus cecorum TaxID=44008 RepID=UPI0006412D02|nr:metal-sensitive transcriptional regulator [Enterococcus cecorum]KLN91804.1 hypothetical protein ABT59_08120 [Enterococcus cecorum]KLN92256.1 hypothetical protein ABT60_09135 [Enterococcus cecorum]KLO65459.1 hypothetical protein AA985_07665 [Enterococcus cecorum]CAI3272553.1 metal-sensitive transcriptional regulator [Enterococcus cecorum]CAI3275830.1 metal-sensitive transcriptional regulator [Enterococcus cecorum]
MPVSDKTKLTHRLKRAEGQIRGVLKMIEEEKECIDIVTQLSAARSSIDRVMGLLVAENFRKCLEECENPEEREAKINQAIQLIMKK